MTPEQALELVPSHGRTSCSDTNVINAHDGDYWVARCARCAILEAITDDVWDELVLDVFINATWRKFPKDGHLHKWKQVGSSNVLKCSECGESGEIK